MKHVFSSVLLAVVALCAAALPLGCHAAALDAPLACNESGHQFIADLAQQQLIDPTPTRVESNSINAFRPAKGADMSAFGFHVFAVVGFEKDDPMFRTGDGEPFAAVGPASLQPGRRKSFSTQAAALALPNLKFGATFTCASCSPKASNAVSSA